jgi:hypothetical protein
MSDAATAPDSFVADEELTFGDLAVENDGDATASTGSDPAPTGRRPRKTPTGDQRPARAPRRKRTESVAPEPAIPEPATAPPAHIMADPAPTTEAVADRPAAPAAAAAPTASAPGRDIRTMLLGAIAGCALLSSLASLGGLIAVSRTLAAAQTERARAAEQAETLARLPAIIARLDAAGARLSADAMHAPDGAAAVTLDQLRHEIDGLKAALDQRQAPGLPPLAQGMRDGFGDIGDRLTRIEQAIGPRRR